MKHNKAWVAGLFEGEGTIITRKARLVNREKHDTVDIQISSVDKDVIKTLAAVVKCGKVLGPYGPYQPNRQLFYKWSVYGADAIKVLKMIFPYLLKRRAKKALEALHVNGAEYVHENLPDRKSP